MISPLEETILVILTGMVLTHKLVGNAHPTGYQGFWQSKNSRFSVP
ncbi:hypothetical protein MC7420_7571 [Coleofasciculus chthonoplastes PCC 7420]|uniref:Uncharacterized protein n=1 Tax=Coleofasciculus chthonoplastes PCC 7420 TaxID=118168 RepID=B4W156_9CYAN|nr:hypothetical protein MC7420_7571 [Coleofasciculus chthonoplastes PCC 7420]